MNDNGGQSFLSFLVGFVVGGLIGAAVALLYAPQSGEETRGQIRDRSIELRDQAVEQAALLREQAEMRMNTLQEQMNELQAKMQKQAPAPKPIADAGAKAE